MAELAAALARRRRISDFEPEDVANENIRLKAQVAELEKNLKDSQARIATLEAIVQSRDDMIFKMERSMTGQSPDDTAVKTAALDDLLGALEEDGFSLPTTTSTAAAALAAATTTTVPQPAATTIEHNGNSSHIVDPGDEALLAPPLVSESRLSSTDSGVGLPRSSSLDSDNLFADMDDLEPSGFGLWSASPSKKTGDPLGAMEVPPREVPLLKEGHRRKGTFGFLNDWGDGQAYSAANDNITPHKGSESNTSDIGAPWSGHGPGRKSTLTMMLGEQDDENSIFASVDREEIARKKAQAEAEAVFNDDGGTCPPPSSPIEEGCEGAEDDNTNSSQEVYSTTSSMFHISDSERSRGYRKFLDVLRESAAMDILSDIKSFLMSVLMPQAASQKQLRDSSERLRPENPETLDVVALDERCKVWFERMEEKFMVHPLWIDGDEKALIMAREGLEKYVMTKLFKVAFSEISVRVVGDDQAFVRRRDVLRRFITAEDLEVHHACRNQMTVGLASNELNKLNNYRAPVDKLQCIVRCCSFLFNQLSVSRGSDGSRPGADDFLPVLIYVVLNSSVPHMHANLEYIQNYRNSQDLMSKAGYCLVNLQSSVAFLTNVSGDSFPTMGTQEFDRRFHVAEQAVDAGQHWVSPWDHEEE
jgi:hypothetical protein